MKIREVAYHRNGVAGTGFHVVFFTEGAKGGSTRRRKIAVVFPRRREIAVFDVERLAAGVIGGGGPGASIDKRNAWDGPECNAWDGPEFEDAVREAILDYEAKRAQGTLSDEERRDLLYGKHECLPYTRDGGLIRAEEKIGTCVVCGVRVPSMVGARENNEETR